PSLCRRRESGVTPPLLNRRTEKINPPSAFCPLSLTPADSPVCAVSEGDRRRTAPTKGCLVRSGRGALMSGRTRSTPVTAASTLPAVPDFAISTLAAVLDPEELGKQLRGLPLSQRWEALQDVQIKVLRRHSAKRCTFEIVLRTGLVGKV